MDKLRAYGWQLAFLGSSAAALVLTLTLCFANGDRRALRVEVQKASERAGACIAERNQLRSSLDDQNRAVDDLRAVSDLKERAADKARKEAAREAEGLRQRIARLQASKSGPDQCESARALAVETLKADRP